MLVHPGASGRVAPPTALGRRVIPGPSCGMSSPHILYILEKWFPLQGKRAHSLKKNLIKSNFFALLSSSISRAILSCVFATIFSSLAVLSTSVSMANLSCLLATTFSRYRDVVHRYRDMVHRYRDMVHRYRHVVHRYWDISLQLIFITSLQSFESGMALILIVFCYLLLTTFSSSSCSFFCSFCSIFFASYPKPFSPLFYNH